jgi:hypothetical protein
MKKKLNNNNKLLKNWWEGDKGHVAPAAAPAVFVPPCTRSYPPCSFVPPVLICTPTHSFILPYTRLVLCLYPPHSLALALTFIAHPCSHVCWPAPAPVLASIALWLCPLLHVHVFCSVPAFVALCSCLMADRGGYNMYTYELTIL